jgi:FHA domain
VLAPGTFRNRIARTLNTAYADGLLSEDTFSLRVEQLFAGRVIDSSRLIGDLSLRDHRRSWRRWFDEAVDATVGTITARWPRSREQRVMLLALDWTGAQHELVLGRRPDCDVVFANTSVSRRHARLRFRDGKWVLQDLDSTNGSTVNGANVGRCELLPGDRLGLGEVLLTID